MEIIVVPLQRNLKLKILGKMKITKNTYLNKSVLKRILLIVVIAMIAAVNSNAQIDPQVREVLKKSQEKMSSPYGTEIEMTIDVTLMVKLTGMKIRALEKNNKTRLFLESKVMGQELVVESGFDGKQEWQYVHRKDDGGKAKRDTLTIIKTTQKPKNEYTVDFGMDKNYKAAKMKVDGQYYEITLTKPIKKDSPSKVVMKIDRNKYYFREMTTKVKGTTMTMKLSKIKIGVSDDLFKLDLKKYPNAIVVRK